MPPTHPRAGYIPPRFVIPTEGPSGPSGGIYGVWAEVR